MSRDLPRTKHRGYEAQYTVRYTGSQRDRFGVDKRQDIRVMMLDNNDNEDYPENFNGEWEDFPRVSRLRENLTALSQHYNLYFVAYRGWIHVHVPGRGAGALLGPPIAALDPERSRTPMAAHTVGHVNRACPHSINHVKVGDLGDREILLITRDNGDVVAWYTEPIARLAEDALSPDSSLHRVSPRLEEHDDGGDDGHGGKDSGTRRRLPSPRHFFADNVGMSAWGLAIHKRDRLIAVSSNTQEVTVFAFALAGDDPDAQFANMPPGRRDNSPERPARGKQMRSFPISRLNFLGGPLLSSQAVDRKPLPRTDESIRKLERRFRTRTRTWRIVIPFGQDASNLPSVSFCEDEAGHADRVAALDIRGYLFIAEIWTVTSRHVKIPPHNVQYPNGAPYDTNVTGWSVLPVTDAQLMRSESLKAAIGMSPRGAVYRGKHPTRGTWLDISKSMASLHEDAAITDHKIRRMQYQEDDFSTERDGLEREPWQHNLRLQISAKVREPVFADDEDDDTRLAMTMVPPTGDHYAEFRSARDLVEFAGARGSHRRLLELPSALKLCELRAANHDSELLRGVSFLRANEEDVEMLTLDHEDHDVGLVCHHVLANVNPTHQLGPWDTQFGRRCSMLLTIPELHLVVLGSMCGRVALLTLTRPPREDGDGDAGSLPRRPRRAFRVDAVLPFKSEEYTRQRPYVCLLGIAVSPVPETERVSELRRRVPTAPGGRRKRRRGRAGPSELAPEAPRRWRLVLNYMDHTVLQYELTRQGGEVGLAAVGDERVPTQEARALQRGLNDLGVDEMLEAKVRRRARHRSSGSSDAGRVSAEDTQIRGQFLGQHVGAGLHGGSVSITPTALEMDSSDQTSTDTSSGDEDEDEAFHRGEGEGDDEYDSEGISEETEADGEEGGEVGDEDDESQEDDESEEDDEHVIV